LSQLDKILPEYCPAAAYALISDSHMARLREDLAKEIAAAGNRVELLNLPAGEWNKTRDTWHSLSDECSPRTSGATRR